MSVLKFISTAVRALCRLRARIKGIDNRDPVVHRLNEICTRFISEKLQPVSGEWIRRGLRTSIRLNLLLTLGSFFNPKKWLYCFILLIITVLFFRTALLNNSTLVLSLILLIVFGKSTAFRLCTLIFEFIDYYWSGEVMKNILFHYSLGRAAPKILLNPYGPIFPLLGLYAELMSAEDRRTYEGFMEAFWAYNENGDLDGFEAMEREFWADRERCGNR